MDYKRLYYYVFVYGTLKRGYPNNSLLKNSKFIDTARTFERYALFAQGIPFVHSDKKISTIVGEVYLVNENTLNNLDILEGYDGINKVSNWYERDAIDIVLDSGKLIEAFIYFNNKESGYLIKSGNFDDYVKQFNFNNEH